MQYEFAANASTHTGTGNGQFKHPHTIDVDSKDNVYVGVLNQPGVQVFDSNGTFLTRWGLSGTGPGQFSIPQEHIAIDKNDFIYIVDGASNPRVQKFFTNGTLAAIIGTTGSSDGQLSQSPNTHQLTAMATCT